MEKVKEELGDKIIIPMFDCLPEDCSIHDGTLEKVCHVYVRAENLTKYGHPPKPRDLGKKEQ